MNVPLSFRQVCEEWLQRHAEPNKVARAVEDDMAMLERHVWPRIGYLQAARVTKRDIIDLLDAVVDTPDARFIRRGIRRKVTHRPNRVFAVTRGVFRWAHARDLIPHDPTAGVRPPIKKERSRTRVLSLAEIKTFWSALDAAPYDRTPGYQGGFPMTRATAIALKLALATGQRIGEIVGAPNSELDLGEATWTISEHRTKNGQEHRIPLSPLAVELIQEARWLAPESKWLFPSPYTADPILSHTPCKAIERSLPYIGLPAFRVHDLRRTAATRMAELGVDLHVISMVLNHISARSGNVTAAVYIQYGYDKEKRAALELWGAMLGELVNG